MTIDSRISANRIGFVTYHHAKDAIKAKKVLNEDPKSKFKGLIQVFPNLLMNHLIKTPNSLFHSAVLEAAN